MGPWMLASNGYGGDEKPGQFAEYELRTSELQTYTGKGYPNRHTRYRELEKNLFEVEVWLENNVKSRGVLGKAITRLVARYTLLLKKSKEGQMFLKHGVQESWWWNGKLRQHFEYDGKKLTKNQYGSERETLLYSYDMDEQGRLEEYYDARYDPACPREVKYQYGSGERRLVKWRGKYHLKEAGSYGTMEVTRNTNGKPLSDEGDFTISKYDQAGRLVREENYVAGKQHGFTRIYNAFGRVIGEEFWVRGIQVPEWVYLDPKAVTPEEIQAEDNEELREIMLELQGTELYQVRAMARGMRAVARTRLACEDAALSAELLAVRRPSLVEAKK